MIKQNKIRIFSLVMMIIIISSSISNLNIYYVPNSHNAYAASAITSNVRFETSRVITYANGTHLYTGGLEKEYMLSNGTYIPYILTSNSTHILVDSTTFPFTINKNTCIVTIYDNSKQLSSNPQVLVGQDYWNYGYKKTTDGTYTIVDTSSLPCKLTQITNSSGLFISITKSDANAKITTIYAKRNDQKMETFATVQSSNSTLNGYNFEPVYKIANVNVNAILAYVLVGGITTSTSIADGQITLTNSQIANYNFDFTNKVNNIFNFDFRLTSNNFLQVTGTKSNGIVSATFEFGRNTGTLNNGQSITIDPTFGYNTGTVSGVKTNQAGATLCNAATGYVLTGLQEEGLARANAGQGTGCIGEYARFDISTIPSNNLNITSALFKINVTATAGGGSLNCNYTQIQSTHDPATEDAQTLYYDVFNKANGTFYATNSANCQTVANNVVLTLPSTGRTDIQNQAAQGWWAIGITTFVNTINTCSSGSHCFRTIPVGSLQVVYTSSPDKPTSLKANTISTSEIDLSWVAPTNNGGFAINGYKIERESPLGGGWSTLVANTTTTVVTYSNTGLTTGTQYDYRVSAGNKLGFGLPSGHDYNDTINSAPTGVTASPMSSTVITVSWTAPSGRVTGYRIDSSVNAAAYTTIVTNTTTTVVTYSNTGLTSGNTYAYKIYTYDNGGISVASTPSATVTLGSCIYVNDGNTASEWKSNSQTNPWCYVDLSSAQIPTAMAIYPDTTLTTCTQVKIQTSTDTSTWNDKRTINLLSLTNGAWNYFRWDLDGSTERYIRTYCTDSGSKVLAIWEIKILIPSATTLTLRHGHEYINSTDATLPLNK